MVDSLRTLIVDDEPVARGLLARMLARHPRAEVVGQCSDGPSSVEAIRSLRPDVVLLDVQMPGMDGFDVLEALAGEPLPAIVFVTAHDEFAVRAFEVHATDYVLKPVDEQRLGEALERIARAPSARAAEWLLVRSGEHRVPLRWEEIVWFESAGNYVRVHARDGEYLLRSTLSALAERLADRSFARIHRTVIVNVTCITSIQPAGHGDCHVHLAGGARLPLSRRYRERLEDLVGRTR